jgi:alpha-L-fucosidase
MFNEDKQIFTSADVRFTQKNGVLYALLLDWPEGGHAQIAALADGAPQTQGAIEQVELMGSDGALAFRRNASGLQVTLPENRSGDIAYALRIRGRGLV